MTETIPANAIHTLAERLVGGQVKAVRTMAGGRNSATYRIDTPSDSFALKVYPPRSDDTRDRFGTETATLKFLKNRTEWKIPEVLAEDETAGAVLFDWIEGKAAPAVTEENIIQCAAFLTDMAVLSDAPGSELLPTASEACFTASEILRQIEARMDRFSTLETTGALVADLMPPLLPACRERANKIDCDTGLKLSRKLSPSDFGLHNAIACPDGKLAFVDFEYFGWDDPAKPVCDFMLHPGMSIDHDLEEQFLAAVSGQTRHADALQRRVRGIYPLLALRWALIVLNPIARPGTREKDEMADMVSRQIRLSRNFCKTAERCLNEHTCP